MLKRRWLGIPVVAIMVFIVAAAVASGMIIVNHLDKSCDARYTVTEGTINVDVTVYIDALCTIPMPAGYLHDFLAVVEGGTPQWPLWFKATEVNPATVVVSATGFTGGESIGYIVGTPMGSQPGHPCPIAIWVNNAVVGVHNFTLTVTGHGP